MFRLGDGFLILLIILILILIAILLSRKEVFAAFDRFVKHSWASGIGVHKGPMREYPGVRWLPNMRRLDEA